MSKSIGTVHAAKKAARSLASKKTRQRSLDQSAWKAFEDYGSFAGPPSQPTVSDVGATSLLLHWGAPTHLGGSGFEVVGYQVKVQYAGAGGFNIHTEDTASDHLQCTIEELPADTWHEFTIAAITSAGVGAASVPSRPVLTERAPKLLRELNAATKQLNGQREKLQRRKAELLQMARSGTMALPADKGGTASGAATATAAGGSPPTGGAPPMLEEDEALGLNYRSDARLSATDAKERVQRRRSLERQAAALQRKVEAAEAKVVGLKEEQRAVDKERKDELDEVATQMQEAYESGETPELNMPSRARMPTHATVGISDTPYGTNTASTAPGTPYGGSVGGGFYGAARALQAASNMKRLPGGRRRSISEQKKHTAALQAYQQLFMQEDLASVEEYPPFDREAVRRQMRNALKANVLADGSDEKTRYFDLCLNRVRSALTHNVFPRFADWELEQLCLLFGRFDTDNDGVLEFADFCRLMLLVGGRVNATYLEPNMLRMFKKVDVNNDKLIDLNEFLLMQISTKKKGASHPQTEKGSPMFILGADGSPSAAEEVETAPAVGVHPHPSTLPEKKRVEDPAPRGAFSKAWAAIGVGYGDELEGEEELDEWPEDEEDEDEEDVLDLVAATLARRDPRHDEDDNSEFAFSLELSVSDAKSERADEGSQYSRAGGYSEDPYGYSNRGYSNRGSDWYADSPR